MTHHAEGGKHMLLSPPFLHTSHLHFLSLPRASVLHPHSHSQISLLSQMDVSEYERKNIEGKVVCDSVFLMPDSDFFCYLKGDKGTKWSTRIADEGDGEKIGMGRIKTDMGKELSVKCIYNGCWGSEKNSSLYANIDPVSNWKPILLSPL